jgi:hypothetical protein
MYEHDTYSRRAVVDPDMQGTERTPDEAPDRVPDEVVADLLADDRRRLVAVLAAADEPLAVDDLARAVLARERDVDPGAVGDEAAATLREEVFQRHLPRLTPTGLVSYDSLVGTVALDTDDERVRAALE